MLLELIFFYKIYPPRFCAHDDGCVAVTMASIIFLMILTWKGIALPKNLSFWVKMTLMAIFFSL